MLDCLAVGFGGFFGCIARYLCMRIPSPDGFSIVKTLCINCLGSFILSFVAATATRKAALSPRLLLMLKIGVCGGFTTFSTFAFESGSLFSQGTPVMAAFYIVASVFGGLLSFFLGQLIG